MLVCILASLGFNLDIYDFVDAWLLIYLAWSVISLLMAT